MAQKPVIAMITKNRINPAYGAALLGAERVAERYGATIVHSAPAAADHAAEQEALVDRAIASRPAAIILLPAHETALGPAIARAVAADIPIVLIVGRPKTGRWLSFVGTDNTRLADTMARRLFDHLGGRGNVVIVDGHPNAISTPERQQGYAAAAADYPGIRILESRTGYYQREPGQKAARDLLDRHPDIDGIIASNDLMALGVLDALDEAGRPAPVVSANAIPEAIEAVRAGRLLATASYDTLGFGSLAAEAALRHLRGEPVPFEILLPSVMVDRNTAEQWARPYEERTAPAWDAVIGA